MTTAIAVYDSDGLVGRCDARCHFAAADRCDCICGGRLHGSGQRALLENAHDLFGDELGGPLAAFAERNALDASRLRVEFPGQLALPT